MTAMIMISLSIQLWVTALSQGESIELGEAVVPGEAAVPGEAGVPPGGGAEAQREAHLGPGGAEHRLLHPGSRGLSEVLPQFILLGPVPVASAAPVVAGQDSVLLQCRDSVATVATVEIVESVGNMLPVKMAAMGVGLVARTDIMQSATLAVSLV